MKKILFFIAGIWVSFMVFLVFRDQIDQVLAGSTEDPVPVVQSSEPDRASPQLSTPEVSVPKPVFVKEPKKLPDEEVPFAPLYQKWMKSKCRIKKRMLRSLIQIKRLLPCLFQMRTMLKINWL